MYSLFHKIEGPFPNSFYVTSVTLLPKSDKDSPWKENYRLIFLLNTYAKSSTKRNKLNPTYYIVKKTLWQKGVDLGYARLAYHSKINQRISLYQQTSEKPRDDINSRREVIWWNSVSTYDQMLQIRRRIELLKYINGHLKNPKPKPNQTKQPTTNILACGNSKWNSYSGKVWQFLIELIYTITAGF